MPRLLCLFALLMLSLAACVPGDPGSTVKGIRYSAEQIAQGRVYYEQTCAACHGLDGQGQFPDAPLEPDATGRYGAPPHNEGGHTWHHSDELILRYIIEGGFADPRHFYQMPPFGSLYDREQAALIVAYVKTMWTEEQRIYQFRLTAEEEKLVAQTEG
ncbi:MAG: cytochrome c [Anaerolineae bacterium]|nr:cytochrome c [Anaerolineae bacterium]